LDLLMSKKRTFHFVRAGSVNWRFLADDDVSLGAR
jgi:hypothetical protein